VPAVRTALMTTRRTRAGARLVAVALAGSLVLAGCTGGEDPPGPGPTPEPSTSASPERTVLRFAVYGTEAQQESYADVARAFERTRPDLSVELIGYPTAEAARRAVEEAAGTEASPDVFLLDGSDLAQVNADAPDLLQPLDELLEERDVQFGDDHQRVALSELSADASLQCMPAEMSPTVLYANEDLLPSDRRLRSLGVELPGATDTWGWSEFAATARAIAVADGAQGVRGTYLPIDLELITAFVRSNGGDIVDDVVEPSVLDLTSDDDLAALRLVAVLAADDTVSLTPEEVAEVSDLDRFVDGDLGLVVGTRADVPTLRASGLDFRVLPLPGFARSRSVSSVTGYCVPATSAKVEIAADFIAFAVSQEGAMAAARRGALVPARLDALSSEAFTQPRRQPSNYRVYADGVRRSEPMPFTPQWDALTRRADRVLTEVLTDPTFDLGVALPLRMEALARQTERLLAPEEPEEGEQPEESPDSSASPEPSE
jgi:multiple sugar transport system substrate-binding protein